MNTVSLTVSLPQDLDGRLVKFLKERPEWSLDTAVECAIEAFLASHRPLVGKPPVALETLEALEIELDPALCERLNRCSPNRNGVIIRALERWLQQGELANG